MADITCTTMVQCCAVLAWRLIRGPLPLSLTPLPWIVVSIRRRDFFLSKHCTSVLVCYSVQKKKKQTNPSYKPGHGHVYVQVCSQDWVFLDGGDMCLYKLVRQRRREAVGARWEAACWAVHRPKPNLAASALVRKGGRPVEGAG